MADLPSILRGWWDDMDAQARARASEYAAKSPGEIGMEFVQEAGPTALGAAAGPLGRVLTAAPKATAGLAGLLAAGMPGEAGAPEPSADPRAQKLRDLDKEIAAARGALEKQATTNFQSKTARENAAAPYLSTIAKAQERKAAIEGELDKEASALQNSSFAKAHPNWNAAWPAIQWGGPLAAAWMAKSVGNLPQRAINSRWNKAVDAAEGALEKGKDAQLAYNVGKAEQFMAREPQTRWEGIKQASDDFIKGTALPVVAGAGVGMEASLFPYQYDRRNAPEGSKERTEAETALGDNFVSTAMKGLAPGVLGGLTGSHILPSIGAGYKPIAETKNLSSVLKGMQPAGPVPPGPPGPGAPAPPGLPAPAVPGPAALPAPAAQPLLPAPPQGPPPLPGGPPNQRVFPASAIPGNTNKALPKGFRQTPWGIKDKKGRWTEDPSND